MKENNEPMGFFPLRPFSCLPLSFATGCTVDGGNVRCACKPGYTGPQCER